MLRSEKVPYYYTNTEEVDIEQTRGKEEKYDVEAV